MIKITKNHIVIFALSAALGLIFFFLEAIISPKLCNSAYYIPARVSAPILNVLYPNFVFTEKQQVSILKRYLSIITKPPWNNTLEHRADKLYANFIIQNMLEHIKLTESNIKKKAILQLTHAIDKYHLVDDKPHDTPNISNIDAWRFFVNGIKQNKEQGWAGYESREKNSIQAFYNSWIWMQEQGLTGQKVNEPLSLPYIKRLHQLATSHDIEPFHSGKFKPKSNHYDLEDITTTPLGILEIFEKSKNKQLNFKLASINHAFYIIPNIKNTQENFQYLIESYETKISDNAKNHIYIIEAILDLLLNLNYIHPFKDGNGRVATLLLNKELMRHGFLPVILDDPNRIGGGFSKHELFQDIAKGWDNFYEVATTGRLYKGPTTQEFYVKNLRKGIPYPIQELKHLLQ